MFFTKWAFDIVGAYGVRRIRKGFEAALKGEYAVAISHRYDSYYTDNYGHNIGSDELLSLGYAKRISLQPTGLERNKPGIYLERLLADLEHMKLEFRERESDKDGYGIGTLHSLSQWLIDKYACH